VPTSAPPHSVPAGPLAVRWVAHDLPPYRAGATAIGRLDLENAGTAAWRSRPGRDIHLSYHWLDPLGNPIVWAGAFIMLPERVEPGERIAVWVTVQAPMPPGAYRLAFDLVNEGRYWFRELGNERLELEMEVLPRIAARTLAVTVAPGDPALAEATRAALAAQDEPIAADGSGEATAYLLAGCRPAPDWSRRILDAHEEGFAAVGGSVAVDARMLGWRGPRDGLAEWRPGFGRMPGWTAPLLCPSLLPDVEIAPVPGPGGLPAVDPAELTEASLCDGRIRVDVAARALRRGGRRPA
jgi:hypothetical protein